MTPANLVWKCGTLWQGSAMHAGQISLRLVLCSCLYLSEHTSNWKHGAGSFLISSSCLISVKAEHVDSPGLSYFLSWRRSRQTFDDNQPTRSNRLKKKNKNLWAERQSILLWPWMRFDGHYPLAVQPSLCPRQRHLQLVSGPYKSSRIKEAM